MHSGWFLQTKATRAAERIEASNSGAKF